MITELGRRNRIFNITVVLFMILIMFFVTFQSEPVFAKLVLPGPELMLKDADLIITGVVTKLTPTTKVEDGYIGTIQVNHILKGSFKEKEVTLTEDRYSFSKAWLQRIPPKNTQVLVLLKIDENGKPYFFVDGNQIAIIKDNKVVQIYQGINQHLPYVKYYNDFYQKNKKLNEKAIIKDNSKMFNSKYNLQNKIAGILLLVIVIVLLTVYLKKKPRK